MFSTASGIAGYNALSGMFEGLEVTGTDSSSALGRPLLRTPSSWFETFRTIPEFYLTPRNFFSGASPQSRFPVRRNSTIASICRERT